MNAPNALNCFKAVFYGMAGRIHRCGLGARPCPCLLLLQTVGGLILEKPVDKQDAYNMLSRWVPCHLLGNTVPPVQVGRSTGHMPREAGASVWNFLVFAAPSVPLTFSALSLQACLHPTATAQGLLLPTERWSVSCGRSSPSTPPGDSKQPSSHPSSRVNGTALFVSCRLNGKEHSVFTGVAIVHCSSRGTWPGHPGSTGPSQ